MGSVLLSLDMAFSRFTGLGVGRAIWCVLGEGLVPRIGMTDITRVESSGGGTAVCTRQDSRIMG